MRVGDRGGENPPVMGRDGGLLVMPHQRGVGQPMGDDSSPVGGEVPVFPGSPEALLNVCEEPLTVRVHPLERQPPDCRWVQFESR
jgi:hypothetical protein